MQPVWNGGSPYPATGYAYFNPAQPQAVYPAPLAENGHNAYGHYYQVPWPGAAPVQPFPIGAGPPGQTPMPRRRRISRPSNGNGVQPALAMPEPNGGGGGETPASRPQPLGRAQTVARKIPLRSAMKKGRSASTSAVPLGRTRTHSDSPPRPSTPYMTRQRTNSTPRFVADHIFLSFHGANELRLDNVHQSTLEHIQEQVLPMWPHSVDSVDRDRYRWRARFARSPWSANGNDGIIARRMILHLFLVLARHGYKHLTSADTASPIPRLVFVDEEAQSPVFFMAAFSRDGYKVTLVDPPLHVGESIGESLRTALPHKIASNKVSEDGIYTIELKRNSYGAAGVDKNVFVSNVLKQLNGMNFRLEATIALPRTGVLGFGGRKELWVFKEKTSRREA